MAGTFIDKLGEWIEACLKRWLLFGSVVTGTIAASTTVVAYWDDIRPFATRAEVALVAEHAYPPALSEVQGKMLYLQKRMDYLEQLGRAGELKPDQWIERTYMRGLIRDLKEKETQLIKEQARFRLYREHK